MNGYRCREDRRLLDVGGPEAFSGALEANRCEIKAEDRIGLLEYAARGAAGLGNIQAHPHTLRTLPRKDDGQSTHVYNLISAVE